jgi:hypothetical protein
MGEGVRIRKTNNSLEPKQAPAGSDIDHVVAVESQGAFQIARADQIHPEAKEPD